ncbi:MAG TPA: PKD domain-containing protein [Sedimentisphaerales bacterium]|nr:PKD domain-containing protein [Sedimentisphaerales bacterium]
MRTSIRWLQAVAFMLAFITTAGIALGAPYDLIVQVQVTDALTGQPIPNAKVAWITLDVPLVSDSFGSGSTDATGSYSFWAYYGSGYLYRIRAGARNHVCLSRDIIFLMPGNDTVNMVLDPVDGTAIINAGPDPVFTVATLPYSDFLQVLVNDPDEFRPLQGALSCSTSVPDKFTFLPNPPEVSGSYLVPFKIDDFGVYDLTFTYTDEWGDTASTTLWVTVQRLTVANHAPVAEAGGPYTGFVGQSIILDASGSYDDDGDVLTYEWDLDADGQYDDATGAIIQHTWNYPWSGSIRLRATDTHGATGTDTATVTINETTSPVITTVQGTVREAGTGLEIQGAHVWFTDTAMHTVPFAVETDPLGFYQVIHPELDSCDFMSVGMLHYIPQYRYVSITPDVVNVQDFDLVPTDGKPIVDAGPSVTYTTNPPVSALAVQLNGSVEDPDGGPFSYPPKWTKVSGPGTVTFDGDELLWASARFSTYGEYVLKLEYSDGESTVSDTVTIRIEPAQGGNECPEVDAGPASMTATVNVPLALQGSASDPDDGPQALTIEWSKTSGPGTVAFQDKRNPTTTATFSMVGTYVLRLWCNDGACDDSDTVSVEVTAGGGSGTIPWIRAAYWDTRYSTSWVHGSAIRDALQSAGYEVLNADQLALWMDARIVDGKPSVVVFCQDLAPDTVYEAATSSCTLREYLDAGGKIVWYGDIPLYYQGHSNGMRTEFGTGGSLGALGFNAAGGVWDRGEQVTLTEDGRSWGLTQTWVSTRPALSANVRVLARDSVGQAAGWVKHFVSGDGYRGFVRFSDSGAVPGVADVRRVAEYPNTPALVAHWTLDGDAADSAGGHDGTLYGNPVWLPTGGKIGGALKFDGQDDYVDTKFTENLAKWTICCWVSSPAAPSNGAPSGPIHREQNLQINWNHSDPKFRSAAGLSVGGTWYAASFGTLAANTWYHLAATYDGVSLKAYRDGELITTTPCPGTPASEASSLKLGRHAVQANFFSGTIDDVYVYSSALGQSEIQALMGTGVLSILEVVDNGIIDDEQMCRTSLDSTTGTRVEYTAAVLNLHDSGPSGHFGNDQPFGVVKEGRKTAGSVDNLSLRAEGVIHISAAQAGNWTFGVNSDDGFTLLFPGRNFTSVTNGELYSTAQGKAIRFFGGRALADTLGVIHLPAGDHPFWLTYHEGVLEAAVEFFAAQGVYTAFDPQVFRLVGQ